MISEDLWQQVLKEAERIYGDDLYAPLCGHMSGHMTDTQAKKMMEQMSEYPVMRRDKNANV